MYVFKDQYQRTVSANAENELGKNLLGALPPKGRAVSEILISVM
jgi:hypothetical protein